MTSERINLSQDEDHSSIEIIDQSQEDEDSSVENIEVSDKPESTSPLPQTDHDIPLAKSTTGPSTFEGTDSIDNPNILHEIESAAGRFFQWLLFGSVIATREMRTPDERY